MDGVLHEIVEEMKQEATKAELSGMSFEQRLEEERLKAKVSTLLIDQREGEHLSLCL